MVSLMPTTIPITGVPDATSDARTIGTLAWTMLAGETFTQGEGPKPLAELVPNQAVRVVEATEKMARSEDADDLDIPTFLGIIAAGDALKQAEVELAAQKELYDEQHRAELQKCENHRIEVEQHCIMGAAEVGAIDVADLVVDRILHVGLPHDFAPDLHRPRIADHRRL